MPVKRIKYIALLLLSLLWMQVRLYTEEKKDRIVAGFDGYSDDGGVQVYSPMFDFYKGFARFWTVGLKMRIDAISSASIRNGGNTVTVDAVTGASARTTLYDDTRYAYTMQASYDDGLDAFSVGGYYSSEIDYTGRSVFAGYVTQWNKQNTALGVHLSASFDRWKPLYQRRFSTSSRNEQSADLSLSQLITPRWSMQMVYSLIRNEGLLSSPYHFLLQSDMAVFERYPSDRLGHAGAVHGIFSLTRRHALHLSYRYYTDDWRISSHTTELQWYGDIATWWTSGMRLRYYTQTKADFTKKMGTYSTDDRYIAIDYRMSGFRSYTIGLPMIFRPGGSIAFTGSLDYYITSPNEYIRNWYGQSRLHAVFSTLSMDFAY